MSTKQTPVNLYVIQSSESDLCDALDVHFMPTSLLSTNVITCLQTPESLTLCCL